jgi:hypothetical protein
MDEQNTGIGTARPNERGPAETGARRRTTAGRDYPTASSTREDEDEGRTDEIRAEIAQTRGEMSETVDAIQERLRPSNIASNAAEGVKRAASEKMYAVADSSSVSYLRANPLATAMVGVGIAGVAMLARSNRPGNGHSYGRYAYDSGRWQRGPSYGPRYSRYDVGEGYGAAGRETPELDERGAYMQRSSEWAGGEQYYDEQRHQDRGRSAMATAQHRLRRSWNQSPLLVGAAAAVAGAIVGLAIPETEAEQELMGEARDSMISTVQNTAREKINDVQEAASNAMGTVQEAAKSAVGLVGEPEKGEKGKTRSPKADRQA